MAKSSNGQGSKGGRMHGVSSGDGKVYAPKGRKLDASSGSGPTKTGPGKGSGPAAGPMGHAVQNTSRMPA